METTKNLTLSEVAEKNITNFDPDQFSKFEIGRLNGGQILCYFDGLSRYIALINPQDDNFLFFADEFPYDFFPNDTQEEIHEIFETYN
jgi:hypothetical protein